MICPEGVGEIQNVAVATVPLAIMLELTPARRQVYVPVLPAQLTVLLAPTEAGPAATWTDTISPGEYWKVHSSPAGRVPVAAISRLSTTVPPGNAEPGSKLSAMESAATTELVDRLARNKTRIILMNVSEVPVVMELGLSKIVCFVRSPLN